jgi:hypothetical protein
VVLQEYLGSSVSGTLAGCGDAEVIDRVRELGWKGIVGNTDELLWRPEDHARRARKAPKLQELRRLLGLVVIRSGDGSYAQ